MSRKQQKLVALILGGIIAPCFAFGAFPNPINEYDNVYLLLNFYSLVSAMVVGLVTTAVVLVNGKRMKGGVLGSVLNFFGIGMLFMLGGFLFSFATGVISENIADMLNSVLNIIGFVIMAAAGNKLFAVTKQK